MSKNFKPVIGTFGGIDEQATQDAFVDFVGGMSRAEALSRISQNSWPSFGAFGKPVSKTDVFRAKALREGFTKQQIEAFLSL